MLETDVRCGSFAGILRADPSRHHVAVSPCHRPVWRGSAYRSNARTDRCFDAVPAVMSDWPGRRRTQSAERGSLYLLIRILACSGGLRAGQGQLRQGPQQASGRSSLEFQEPTKTKVLKGNPPCLRGASSDPLGPPHRPASSRRLASDLFLRFSMHRRRPVGSALAGPGGALVGCYGFTICNESAECNVLALRKIACRIRTLHGNAVLDPHGCALRSNAVCDPCVMSLDARKLAPSRLLQD